jgi:hypothetical protein
LPRIIKYKTTAVLTINPRPPNTGHPYILNKKPPSVGERLLTRELQAMERPKTTPVSLMSTDLVKAEVVMIVSIVPPLTKGTKMAQN